MDYESVKDVIIYNYNNGVFEGNVNRLTMIKALCQSVVNFHFSGEI